MSLALTFSAMFGFVYGVFRFFRSKSPLYAQMVVLGIGCAMLGRLFVTLRLITLGELRSSFHVGTLGILGSFLFFISANYGQMDSLVDDGRPDLRKYRWAALCAPLSVLVLYAVYFRFVGFGEGAIVTGIVLRAFHGDVMYVTTTITPVMEEIVKTLPILYYAAKRRQ